MTRIIRPAGLPDLDALCVLSADALETAWDRHSLEADLSGGVARILLCEIDGIPAGFVHWWRLPDEAEIMNVAVAPAYRRRGIAADLLQHMLEQAGREGAAAAFLEVSENNTAARQLYARAGFRPVGERRNYYPGSCENAIILRYSFV